MIRWYSLRDVTRELGYLDTRTFKTNHMNDYPPDRENGKRKWWAEQTVNKIKREVFGVDPETEDEEEGDMEEGA